MSVPNQKISRILIVDDDPATLRLVEGLLLSNAASVTAAMTLSEGLRLAGQQRFDVILLNHLLPDGRGLDAISKLFAEDRLRPIFYITAQPEAHTAIEAIKRGAFDYLAKPLGLAMFQQRLLEALEYRSLTRLPVLVDAARESQDENEELVGRCRAMQEVYKNIGRLANLTAPVLIEGEVGTGKEMIARAIHRYGIRQSAPFVKLSGEQVAAEIDRWQNAGTSAGSSPALAPATLLELAPYCGGGTLLLEEIAGLSAAHQSHLLSMMRHQRTAEPTDVRLIVSTSVPSRQLLERGTMRSDLFYYLSPYTVRVPALRDREEDFELLVAHFMQRLAHVAAASEQQAPPRVSPAAMALLRSYDWPGNIAQLKSVLQSVLMESRGAVLATDALRRSLECGDRDLQTERAASSATSDSLRSPFLSKAALTDKTSAEDVPSGPWDLAAFVNERLSASTDQLYDDVLAQVDKALLTLVLQHTRGNQAQAAKHLGMTRTSLRKKIASSHIDLTRLAQPQPLKHGFDLHPTR